MGESLSSVAQSLADVSYVFNQACTMITGNALAMFFVGVPVIGAGIGLFHRLISH